VPARIGDRLRHRVLDVRSRPPPDSLFGRARTPGEQVLCTNPRVGRGSGALDPDFPTHLSGLFGIGNLAGARRLG